MQRAVLAFLFGLWLAHPVRAASVMPIWQNDTAANTLSFQDTFGHSVSIGSYNPSTGAWSVSGSIGSLSVPPPIGNTTPNTGAFTTLSASGAVSGAGFSSYLLAPPPIGSGTPNTGAFTTFSASGASTLAATSISGLLTGVGVSNYLAAPPTIGNVTPNTGAFTTLSATSTSNSIGYIQPGTGAIARTMQAKESDIVNLADFVTDTSGATDDTAGISNAIAALPASGGTILINCGQKLKITSTINIGNGTSSSVSTRYGVIFRSACSPVATGAVFWTSPPASGVQFVWGGAAAGTMFFIQGPLDGWGFENIAFDGGASSSANTAINIVSASFGSSRNLIFKNFAGVAFNSTTVPTFGGVTNADSLHNSFNNLFFNIPSNGTGMLFTGASPSNTSNSDYAFIQNVYVQTSAPAGPSNGIVFQNADNILVKGMHCSLLKATDHCLSFDYSASTAQIWPEGVFVQNLDFGANATNAVVDVGTPGTNANANVISDLDPVNGSIPDFTVKNVFWADGTLQFFKGDQRGRTNGNTPTSGYIGEFISSNIPIGSAVPLVSGTSKTITSVSLTAGYWSCTGSVWTAPGGTTTTSQLIGGISGATNTLPTAPNNNGMFSNQGAVPAGQVEGQSFGPELLNVSTTTVEYLVANSAFGVSTMSAYGFLGCIRMQ